MEGIGGYEHNAVSGIRCLRSEFIKAPLLLVFCTYFRLWVQVRVQVYLIYNKLH